MKKILFAIALSLNISSLAMAQHRPPPGPPPGGGPHQPGYPGGQPGYPGQGGNNIQLQRSVDQLRMEAIQLERTIAYSPLSYQTKDASRRLTFQVNVLSNCVRQGFGGPQGPRYPGQNQNCAFDIQNTDRALNMVERSVYGIPFQSPVAQQLGRTRFAMQNVIASQYGPGGGGPGGPGGGGGQHLLVVNGEINRQPFNLQGPNQQTIERICLEFGQARQIYRIESLLVNGRWINNYQGASINDACRLIASQAN